ncbi:Multifunctional-autoprocessing repeats-in-toxin [Vibrio cholerae]|nr:MARTX multifunctional-autoprocessing repeats-in-toxin holotoxin RtxA [Vibrio cholerae]GFK33390.1 Multifunctional-autoprocessing repeats-in-toxin [Vibrio cholerae]GFK36984.1 Multifunctional-autoprocessing repeats-in-toxin [Vibrio cholerae]GFK40185.1 Multifunctional-autoprocessing repeats-in-toxin [Vibrio cholerae]GFK43736.1 Multifunctional-autoprocessing repeats-in-toxin [Vibrio cholerae]GFK47279.1 Multifunctional-autoprocessing repeats-in-toxin [Vibrio cholerae]
MGKPFWRSVEYFFTGNYSADDGNNNIVAIGFGGQIHAYGGDDHVTVGSIGAMVYTGSGNDTVVGGSAYLKVEDSTGHLTVKGAAGYAHINKSGDGNVSFAGAAGGVSIDHLGNHGDISYGGAAAYNGITRKGLSGNVTFAGAGGYNALWHETNQGNLSFTGAGAGNKLDRTWFNRYQGSHGDVTFDGAGAANSISSRVETGNITFRGAGADNHLVRKGKVGDITLQGAGASNRIERTRQAEDVYAQTRGNIRFEGVGGYNSLYSDVAHGDIHFSGGGAYNTITRKGSGSSFDAQGMEYAKAEEIVLTAAQMHGLSIDNGNKFHAVTAVKSEREPNTYLFAIADGTYTKINKVRLYNDPETGKLKYYSEAWFKRGNHLAELARSDVSSAGGFEVNPINGGYTLSNIAVEHQQSVTVHAVEKNLTEYEWVTYANGAVIDAKEVSLSDAKMGGHAIYADGTKVDVKAVKSNRQPNTYIYAKVLGPYTKIVVVELANDPETGALKYQARSWYKEGDHTANIANQDISSATGYNPMGKGGYSLSDLHYSVNAVRSTSETVADIEEYTDQTLFKPANDSGESSGDVRFNGAGGGNVIKSNVTRGNVYFNGGGIANVILHSSQFGNTEFNGGGAANVIVKSGEEGDLTFRGAGLANVLVHQSKQGKMDVYAGGAVNVLVRIGDGQYLAHLLAYGNISVHKGNGNSRVVMLGGYNTHTQIGSGNGLWLAAGGFNVMTQVGKGDVASVLAGGANVLTKVGDGDLTAGMLGGANVITHISGDNETSNTTAVALGGANILTKKGKGNTLAVMGGGANVLTHVGDGTTTGVMVGGANILTKVGNGDTTGIMLGVGNVLTHVGDGQTLGVMGAAGNIFTKVGDGTSIAIMIGVGNIFTHVGEGNAWALMGGLGNVFTKVGNGDALALMVAEANVFTHIGDGMSVALMLAKGNVATKVGNGTTLTAMVGNANIFTHVGSGSTFAAMIGQANIMTKVGNDLTAALMVGKANIYTHVGDGTSLGIFAGEVNVMTKVGNGTTLAAMFGKANIMTHVGDGLTGVLALGEANIVTKVGDDFMGVVAAAKANVVTHVGDATTAAVLAGKGNILTKVGEGTTVGLLISDIGNVMTHVGDGTTIGIAKGKANIITKVGDGLGVNVAWGQANVFTQVGDGDRYNFAKGEANIITKVGDGQEVSVVQGKANIITHVGNGDDYTGAWGKANVITKVGNGRNVVLAKGEANIVTQVGDGDSFNALWSKGNIVTKVGDGMQVTAAKGQANITTTVGNGLNVTAAYGDANINTKVGDGVSVNVAWGKYNINTKVGDGLNVAVMKGKANANIHVGDGLNINASYAQNNVAIKVGNGDFYSLAVASSNTSSNKLSALFDNIKQTVLGVGGSQAINYLVQGDEASSSGTHKGRGAIATPEITKLDGFQMDAIKEVSSDLGDSLTGSVTKVDTPDLNKMQHALNVDDSSVQASNLIVNGDFEQGDRGWKSTHGVEASHSGKVYGVNGEGHGARVTELDTHTNTSIYQDLANLAQGEVIAVSFDFAKRAGLSNNEGIEVLWNGEVVFSSSGDESAWQQKTLKLTAQAGSNRIEFKGTGHNDGLGYILDNVVATSESSQQANAIREHATQNPAAQNALSDKERAEADRQRLEQEKQKQLDAVAGSQSQLESTDQQALENNGQAQRDAVQEESEAITAELTKLAQGLDVLDSQATHTGESGDQWRNEFASGLLAGVQTQLDDAKQLANGKIAEAKQTHADNQNKVKDAVAKSEAGVAKGEQNRAGAEQDIADAQADAEKRKADALAKGKDAQQAESDAHHAVNNAQSRGDRDVQVTENKATQAQADAQGAKQNEGDRPDRQGVTGSGLSGNAHSVEGAGETDSHVKTDSQTNADGRFSEGLTEQEQEALEGATNAVNRLQINAGIRAKNSGSTITTMFTEANTDSIVVPTTKPQDVVRKEIRISGVNLEGLGEASHDSAVSLVAARAEKVANQAQDSFSRLYDQLEAANLKESKHLYLDQNGDFVTKGKGNLANIDLLGSREAVLEKVKLTVSNEYGQTVADTIFAGLSAKDLAKDGKGIDIAGLNKVHQAIEQHLSPVSATLYIWKPSDHSALGHAALQIGQGRTQLEGQAAADFNQQNYVSWWPLGSKSSNISNISKDQPDLKLRWSDFSQPAHQNDTLEHDVASEENDGFGLHDGDIKLKRFIEKLNAAKGIDASFKEASEGYASVLLGNPDMLETTGIPAHVFQPFVEQWNDTSYDMMDVANRFAQELRLQAQRSDDPELLEKRIGNVVRQFAERALEEIETFKASQADQGRVFRINLEGLDVAAMQAEWHRLSNDPDARYQLLTKNCSSTVAKVLKAGGADKLIGHTWLPKFGVWTPTELFNFGQALQEAQLEIAAKKQSHQVTDVLDALSGNEKPKENVAIENDGTPPRDKESLSPLTRFLNNELYGDKEARRKIGEITQTLLDHAVEKGESQKITLQGEAGRLTGYYHQGTAPSEGETSSPSGKVVLFLHGSGSSAEEQASAIRNHYQKQGIDMLAVNLRGYGESDGGPSEKGLYQDARTMFNYLVNDKGIDPSNIIIHGYSMGGPIAADLARYAAQNGQAVSGLLLDRPMPSMTKAITAHELANPAGIVGAIAKAVNGQFSVEKNLEGLPKETSILLLTDNEGLGNEGEKLRTKLTASGYNVTGEQTFYGHEASNRLMSQYADQIVSGLSSSASVDEDLDQQGLDTTSTKDQGISNKNDHLQVVDSKEALSDEKTLHNQDVNSWGPITVTPTTDGGETRFDGQIIVQMENDPVVAKAAANLAGKHAESSVVVQLDSDGNYRVVYGDPSKLDGKLRWQLVGHGRDHSESNNTRLSGYSADELAVKLAKFQQSFNQAENINNKPDHISIVGCSLVSDDKQKGFGHQFINAMDANGLRVDVSVRSSELAVDEAGRKHTKDANGDWVQKAENNKVSLSWDAQGEVVAKDERIRNGIAEGDIDLSRIGVSDVDEPARGAIGDNSDVFDAPEKRKPETEVIANSSNSNQLSYSGNIQVNVGEGEFTAVNWGTSNVGIKVGTGGFKSLAFGDNNVMVHIGDGESKHSVDIGGYQALEGAQMYLGNRNVSFSFGHSNDLILMMDKSIPTPPLVNPFDGAARISGVLQSIATSGEGEDWLAAQEQQWTLSGAKKFVKDMSGLDQSSSVDYTHLVQLNSQNERDSRGLKHDAEATLNKQYNQWLSGNGNSGTSQLSRADKLRQANEKLAFNFAVGGQGADIQVTTGNWNFIFGDNIQSILDTNLGSLFGLMTQQFTATGQAKTTFTYTPQDLPRQLKNKLLGQLAGVGAETTLADIFGVDYTASGQIVSRNGQAVDGVAILKEMLEVIGEFSGDQLQAFVDPAKLLDSLKAGIDMGADGIKSFAETHGLKEKAPEEEKDNSSVSVNGANVNSAQGATMADGNTETAETQDRALGFNSLNLPNLFATIFSQDKQKEMKSLVENLKQNLTADLLNMKEKTFDFLRNSGHLQGDGDINISLGNYNFNWGGDGKDLGAYLGDNNNFWGGRGDDVFYATGTSNIFTGGEGHDMGVLMGRENIMFGGDGNDTAVVAGRINHVFLGAGDDQSFVFGEGGEIDTGSGRDYVVTSGNFNRVDTGDDQDYSVTIGNNNQVELGAGNDFANVFGNYNRINAGAGNDVVKLMGYHAVLNGGDGDDHLIAAAISKFSQFNGGEGRDVMVLGGYQNTFKGGTDVDSFVVSGDVIDNLVEDIRSEDNIVFNGIDWQKLWFERSGYDLKLSILRDPSNDSDQSKFEHIGSVTFSDYFNGNRAQVVIGMSDKDLSGEREYTMLSDSAIDALVQAMSGFEPQAGDNGFIDSLESKSQAAISMAWSDVVHKKGLMV